MYATGTKTGTQISIKNILYATDFSPSAEAALPYAVGLAKRYGAKVHGFHVRPPAAFPTAGPEALPQFLEAAHELAKLAAVQLHAELGGVPHEVSICEGEIWPQIGDIVARQNTDLIVIGTSGRTGVSRFFLGSVAEEILRSASCPVLTVGPLVSGDARRHLEMKEILFATDFSEESLAALPYAVAFAQEHEAGLTMLFVVEDEKVGDLVRAQQHVDSIRYRLLKLLPPDAEFLRQPRFIVEQGDKADKIANAATARGADLIILGVRSVDGGLGVATHLSNSVVHGVITQARCPVLTVRG